MALLIVFLTALISFQGSRDLPLTILIEARQWMRLTEEERHIVSGANVLFAVKNQEEVQYLKSHNVPESDLVVLIRDQFEDWIKPNHWILFDHIENRQVKVPPVKTPLQHNKNLAYELVPWSEYTPVELFGSRFFWVHRVMPWDQDGLIFDREMQRFLRAVRERSVTHLYFEFNFSSPLPVIDQWQKLAAVLDLKSRVKPYLYPVDIEFQPLRSALIFVLLLYLGFYLHFAFFLPILFFLYEYPVSVQLQGFCFCLFSVLWIVSFVIREKKHQVIGAEEILRLNHQVFVCLLFLGSVLYAMMGSLDFEMRIFLPRGIKVLLILPVLIVLILEFLELIRLHKGNWMYALGISWRRVLILSVFGGLGFAWMILRSGNQEILPASQLEIGVREFLEDVLVARPRTREILFWFAPVCLYLALRTRAEIFMLLGMVAYTLLASSSLNTFSHFHTPYWMVVLRTVNAYLIAQGLILLFYCLRQRLYKKSGPDLILGYFGFGNLGDDLLMLSASKKFPDAHFICGLKGSVLVDVSRLVWRHQWLRVFLSLVSSKKLIVGPGGVLQDQSSRLSLLYYCGFILLARCVGAKIEYFGLGMSPLKHQSSKILMNFCNRLVCKAVVRDQESSICLQALGLRANKIEVLPDLVFSLEFSPPKIVHKRVCLILRSAPGIDTLAVANAIHQVCTQFNLPLTIVLFEEDIHLRRGIESILPVVILMEYKGNVAELVDYIGGSECVISMRYHGIVLAHLLNRNILVLSYDAKCHNLATEFKLSEVSFEELMKLDESLTRKCSLFLDEFATKASPLA